LTGASLGVVLLAAGGCNKYHAILGDGGGSGGSGGGGTGGGGGAGGGTGGGTGGMLGDGSASDGSPVDANPPASSTILWARSTSTVFLYGVAEGSTGVEVSGPLSSPADLGGPHLISPVGLADTALAEYSSVDGSYLFATRFGSGTPAGSGTVYGSLNTIGSAGNPIISGMDACNPAGTPACTQIDVGQGATTPGGGGNADGFVGQYSVTSGTASWAARLAGPGNDVFTGAANGPNGSVFVSGFFDQSTTLISAANMRSFTNAGDRDALIAQFNIYTGDIGMTKVFGTPAFEEAYSVAWTGSEIVAAGMFAGDTTFGSFSASSTGFDLWVSKMAAADGTPIWFTPLGGAGDDKYPQIVVDAAGDIYMVAQVMGSAMFGTFPVGQATGGLDIVVARLRNSDGTVMWAKSFGSSGDDGAGSIAISSSGQILVSGTIVGPLEAGGPYAGGMGDAVLVSYSSDGTKLWTKVIGTSGQDYGSGVAAGRNAFYANINLGADIGPTVEGVTILGAPAPSSMILKIQP
jgi:hypothetical protein